MSREFFSGAAAPEAWLPLRISHLCGVRGLFKDGDWIESPYIESEGIRLIQTGNVGLGAYREQGFRYISEATFHQLKCTEVRPGDTLICRMADPVGRACIAPALGVKAITSVDNVILRVSHQHDPRYFVYLFCSLPYLDYLSSECRGGTRDRVSRSFLGRLRVPVPPLPTQTAIADFLDRETAHIDELIEKRKTFLTLIDEKKEALIAKAVNGSILEQEATGKRGWFGRLPRDWSTRRAKFLFRERQDRSETGDEELLTVSHITGVTKRSEKDVNMFLAESMEGYKLGSRGDVVVNTMWAWMGAMGVSPVDGLISPSYGVYAPIAHEFSTDYLDLLLRSRPFVAEVNRRSKGVWSSRLRLYPDAFLDIPFPVPPKNAQRAILNTLRAATEREERLAELSRKSLDRLREFRSALITAAVTGQIDVETWRKRGEADRRLDRIKEQVSLKEALA